MKKSTLNGLTSVTPKLSGKTNMGLRSLAIGSILAFNVSCSTSPQVLEEAASFSSSKPVHVAFAGGGWRAHTGHSGWVMSALAENAKNCPANDQTCLGKVFAKVDTISSNSGGSWFNTMLTYSHQFTKDITRPYAFTMWSDNSNKGKYGGWLGKQEALFDAASFICKDFVKGSAFLGCVAHHYDPNYIRGSLNWDFLVDDLVFHDYPIPTSVKLGGNNRQSWAVDKTLLLAGTLLTNDVVLNIDNWAYDEQYYQICFGGLFPIMHGDAGAGCSIARPPDVMPVTFSSMPYSNATLKAPSFLKKQDAYMFGYSSAYRTSGSQKNTKTLNGNTTDNIPVIKAAAASSAAAGFGASHRVLGNTKHDWSEAFIANDLALGFEVNKNTVNYVDAKTVKKMSLDDLRDRNVFKVADGGPVDNSGVAQLVSYLQLNKQSNGFEIVAFDNVEKRYLSKDSTKQPDADVGIDIASLFLGQPNNEMCMGKNCVTTPDVRIFDSTKFAKTKKTWNQKYHHSNEYQIIYTQYDVTTVTNDVLQIAAGSSGILHAFTVIWNGADTAPQNNTHNGDFKTYATMLDYMENAMQWSDVSGGLTGREHLNKALGLTP